jgi:spore maturation protein CgeB
MTNNSFPLSKLRYDLVQKLRTKYGEDFFSYGANWEGISPDFYFAYPNEESEIYRNCKIAINLSHFDYSRYSSDRLLRLMGSGAFCLSHNFKGIERDFDIKNHLDVWSDIDELISKIDYYLKNEYERESIAKEGCIFVRENCNWDKRIEELKKMIC